MNTPRKIFFISDLEVLPFFGPLFDPLPRFGFLLLAIACLSIKVDGCAFKKNLKSAGT
jgi:hypothetical protein